MSTVDDDQIEQLRRLWDRYGRLLSVVVVIGLVVFGGRYLYDKHEQRQAIEAAALYANFQKPAAGQTTAAIADQLRDKYPRSSYATFVSLIEARDAALANKPDVAEQRLRWVVEHARESADRALARLRLARLLLDQGKAPAAAEALDKDVPPTSPSLLELRADIAQAQGKPDDARQGYQEALAALPADSAQATLVKLKLDALGQP